MNDITEIFGEPISVYTRAQGIADGFLHDVTNVAREFGLRWPVAITAGAWGECVQWTEDDNKRKGTCQDEAGRLADVLAMAAMRMRVAAAKGASGSNVRLAFAVIRTPQEGRGRVPRRCDLVLHVGPGDSGEPVLTVMLTTED
jgi:hypothetical protein